MTQKRTFSIVLDDTVIDHIKQLASTKGISPSSYARNVLKAHSEDARADE
jgi:predicted DNA binding CopG/RHH family protein